MRTAITHVIEREASQAIAIGAAETEGHCHFRKPGICRGITWISSDWGSGDTFVIVITDAQGFTLYTSAALAHNSAGYIDPDILVYDEEHTATVTLGGAPGAGGATVTLGFLIER